MAENLANIFDKVKLQSLQDEIGNDFDDDVSALLTLNGGTIELRRQINDYYTFIVYDTNQEIVIIKLGKNIYTYNCSCKYYNVHGRCSHGATVVKSIFIANYGEDNKSDNTTNQSSPIIINSHTSDGFKVVNAYDFGSSRIIKDFPRTRHLRVSPQTKLISITNGKKLQFTGALSHISTEYTVNDQNDLIIKCSCGHSSPNELCDHGYLGLAYFANSVYGNPFLEFIRKDQEKNEKLKHYGLTVEDEEANLFTWREDAYGKLYLLTKPKHIIASHDIDILKFGLLPQSVNNYKYFTDANDGLDYSIGLSLYLSHDTTVNNPVRIEPVKIENDKKGNTKISIISPHSAESLRIIESKDAEIYDFIKKISFLEFKNYLINESNNITSITNFNKIFGERTRESYLQYFFKILEDNWNYLDEMSPIYCSTDEEKKDFQTLEIMGERLQISFAAQELQKFILLYPIFTTSEQTFSFKTEHIDIFNGKLIKINNQLYLPETQEFTKLLSSIPEGKILFPIHTKEKVIKDILLPLSINFKQNFDLLKGVELLDIQMKPIVKIKEEGDYLDLYPIFNYGGEYLDILTPKEYYIENGTSKSLLLRDEAYESAFIDYISELHTNFKHQDYQTHFRIPLVDVMKNHWFVSFTKKLFNNNISIIGLSELTKIKYRSVKPQWNMDISSGIDWFDLNVNATWDDKKANLKDLKKAILQGQEYVVLEDGSFGQIPEEWKERYTYLFKISRESQGKIQISKKHFTIIDVLYDQIDDELIKKEIDEKKQKLINIDKIKTAPIPSSIKAKLRPYQETGYQWLQILDEVSWGGCLADDMGLGKTLQTITFLQYVKEKYNNPTSLVICPTSLIYNWEDEIKKFAPTLKYHIFYGTSREMHDQHFEEYDIIITSYGTARSDIKTLMKFTWEYIILDESQAIKNPDATTTKAMVLLKSRNKLALSGTPLQNNTFDLYAQLNFLNPGLLGSKEFFRNEYASPIDKGNDSKTAELLKKIIKPFMLRRNKNEVASDLPEKTETILWCKMDKIQQDIYDEYKDFYKRSLTQKLDTDGLAKSGIYILEALLRLRQICDDPRLLPSHNHKNIIGIKINELKREIVENMSNHKILIFSQFTEMLALIKEELDNLSIPYGYLDGSTTAAKRKTQVDQFQNNDDLKIFLISLKAGGVGLNLTAADYVYIVDPWWNPAVEQQAINRTHRIGQVNNIFAYKMICKDTVEEKIIKLQEKKLSLSNELVSDDTAFFKKLTREDIEYLFT